jgi:hypothetical protein
MSALGQKQTLAHIGLMSALPPKADIDRARPDVRFGSKADIARDQLIVRFTPKKRTWISRAVMSALCQKQL